MELPQDTLDDKHTCYGNGLVPPGNIQVNRIEIEAVKTTSI